MNKLQRKPAKNITLSKSIITDFNLALFKHSQKNVRYNQFSTSSLALNGGGRIFHSPSSLIFPACSPVLSDLLKDSLCTALQTAKLWICSTGLSTLLTPSSRQEAWVLGNLFVPTGCSQPAIRWTRGRGGESCV